ncbi:MAG: PAS domain-containing protein [Nitrospiraceae bacterium]|nr:MAG: PAS domain-containing protein [Nitrospiraceae bacterium]
MARKTKDRNIKPSFIAGIGASAGGLEAIEEFFSNMPCDSGLSFVVIQHLPAGHKSVIDSIIKKYTKMKSVQIRDGMKLEPDCIYFSPPDTDVAVMNGTLYLMEPTAGPGAKLPINFFFRSLAESQGEKAICIVLSGTGTDGTSGLKAVKDAGGIVMVQDIKQAKFSGMPESAISTGIADYVLPVKKMPGTLLKYVRQFHTIRETRLVADDEEFNNYLKKILVLIRSRTGHSFSGYKQQSIRRRTERRMVIQQIAKIEAYYDYIQKNPLEIDALFKDLIIRMTGFFRDSEAFDSLKGRIINNILKKKEPGSTIRAWVAGCSTGEEAYSLAMVFAEAMAEAGRHFNIQIFATDIDEDSIRYARAGAYPFSIAADVSTERLSRFFEKKDSAYKVKTKLREMIIFAVHSLVKDPSFSRLDIISCRNLLIYLDSELQQKILQLFHYALGEDGLLFLGSSETTRKFAGLFSPIDKKWSLYKHKAAAPGYSSALSDAALKNLSGPEVSGTLRTDRGNTGSDMERLIERKLLEGYVPACVVINKIRDIIYFKGDIGKYLELPSGRADFNILKMARKDLRHEVRTMIYQAVKEQKRIVHKGVRIMANKGYEDINIIVEPVSETEPLQGHITVYFEEASRTLRESSIASKRTPGKKKASSPSGLEDKLRFMEMSLEAVTEELEKCNNDLILKSEEMRGVNEELQSANEELQTSREELQSTNEELLSVNTQLQEKIEEITQSNNDLSNLFSSTDVGTIFLDINLCIRRFTPSATRLFNLKETDIGRPLHHFSTNILYSDLIRDALDLLETLTVKETEVQTRDGEWYIMRIIPYRTLENVVDGVVITFVDITKMKKAEIATTKAHEFSRTVLNSINDAISIIDINNFLIVDCNEAFLKSLHVLKKDVIGKTCHEVTHRCMDRGVCEGPEHMCPITETVETGKHAVAEHIHYKKDGKKIYVEVSASPIRNEKGDVVQVVHIARDITERKLTEEEFRRTIKDLRKRLDEMKKKRR